MNQEKYQDHEISSIIPMQTEQGIDCLANSIKKHGLLQPIMIFENKILDGRCRYRACRSLGVEPRFIEWEGSYNNAIEYVISSNICRRQLSIDQLAGSAALACSKAYHKNDHDEIKRNPNMSQQCRKFGITKRNLKDAENIYKTHPDKFSELLSGDKSLKQISKTIKAEERQQLREKLLQQAALVQVPENIEIYEGDCVELSKNLPDNSIDAILSDPPYPRENLDCWSALGEIAARVLKPGGFCICYTGVMYLPEVMQRMNKHLYYHWMISLSLSGPGSKSYPRSAINNHRPILIYVKPPVSQSILAKKKTQFRDVIIGSGREKSLHEWQQSEAELKQLIDTFTMPGDTVLDPYAGSGTVLSMAHKMGRHGIGYEINSEHVKTIRARLSGLGQS